MKQKLLLLAVTLLSTMLFSQNRQYAFLDWTTISGTQDFFLKSITKTDAFGNVYVAGATINGSGNYDILLAKYNSSGNQLWIQQYAGAANGHDAAVSLMVTDTYAVLTGAVCNNTLVPESDIITIKYSSAGVLQWASTYNGTGSGIDIGTVVDRDGSGNIYVTGTSYNASFNSDYVTLKYNSSGTQQWVNRYDYSSGLDDAPVVLNTAGANIIVAGAVTHTTNTYKVASIFLSPSTGSITATNIGTVTTTSSLTVVTDLVNDYAGGSIFVGATTVSGQGDNFYVQKINNTLATVWTYTFNGTDNLDDVIKAVAVDASNNVYITGYTKTSTQGRDIVTMKLNSSGALQWTKYYNDTINGDDEAMDMIVDANNDIYITGYGTNTLNNTDYYTIKYNSSGTKIWEIESDGNSTNDVATNMTLDSLNNVIVTGQVELSPGTYAYATARYVQRDVITPTDFNGESPSNNFMYYQNKGQIVDTNYAAVTDVRFYTNNTNPSFYFKNNSSSFVFSRIDTVAATADTLHRIDLTFDNVRNASRTYPMEQQKTGYLNYFLGHLDSTGVTGVMGHTRLVTPDIFPDIDLMYSSNQNGIKYYFIVKPGGDPTDIQMTFTGASSFSLNGTTNALSINSSIGSLTFDRPTAYQLTAGNATVAVTGWTPDWQTNGAANKYKFNTGAYTASLTLVIQVDQGNAVLGDEPYGNLCWSTYFGGQAYEDGYAIAKDNAGNQYIAGYTSSPSPIFPITGASIYQSSLLSEIGGFYSKFDASNTLWYSTYYSGGGAGSYTTFYDIKCKNSNEVVVAGYTTYNNVSMTQYLNNAFNDNIYNGGSNTGLIARFDNNGNRIWASYLGGANSKIQAIDFDSNGNLYVGGYTGSTNFPLVSTPNYNQSFGGSSDAFLIKLDNDYAISWSTYLGGNSYDKLTTVKVDNSNRILIFGYTASSNFPTSATGSAYIDNSLGGASDNFIGAFSSTAQQLWTSYLGGSSYEGEFEEGLNNIAFDNNSIFVVGTTQSSNFPLLNPGGSALYDNSLSVNTFPQYTIGDGYITEFDKSTFQQKWGTLVSGNGSSSFKIADIDANQNLFIAGSTGDHTIPLISAGGSLNQTSYYGGATASTPDYREDGILLNFKTSTRELVWSTLIGGYNDHPYGEEIYDFMILTNDIYMTGHTTAKNNSGFGYFPLKNPNTGNYFDNSFNGSFQDAYISKFCYTNIIGVNEIFKENINHLIVYPNPTTNKLTISLVNQNIIGTLTVAVYSSNGQEVFSSEYQSNASDINISTDGFAEGIYLIKISNKENFYTSKFIKQ